MTYGPDAVAAITRSGVVGTMSEIEALDSGVKGLTPEVGVIAIANDWEW